MEIVPLDGGFCGNRSISHVMDVVDIMEVGNVKEVVDVMEVCNVVDAAMSCLELPDASIRNFGLTRGCTKKNNGGQNRNKDRT